MCWHGHRLEREKKNSLRLAHIPCLNAAAWISTAQLQQPRGYYFETDPDPVAMVIRIELFTHKLSDTNTYWHYVTGVFYLQGLWMNSSTLITMATGSGSVSRQYPQGNQSRRANTALNWLLIGCPNRASSRSSEKIGKYLPLTHRMFRMYFTILTQEL